jgi:hypothetical protein
LFQPFGAKPLKEIHLQFVEQKLRCAEFANHDSLFPYTGAEGSSAKPQGISEMPSGFSGRKKCFFIL